MVIALGAKGLQVEREKTVTVRFRNEIVGVFRADLIVGSAVIIELKCVRVLDASHEAQLLNYLKATGFEVGLTFEFRSTAHVQEVSVRNRPLAFCLSSAPRRRFRLEEQ